MLDDNLKSYTAIAIRARREQSRTDLRRVDAQTEEELERLIAEDEDERGIQADYSQARLVLPHSDTNAGPKEALDF